MLDRLSRFTIRKIVADTIVTGSIAGKSIAAGSIVDPLVNYQMQQGQLSEIPTE